MSVVKSKRSESKFEVIHHAYKLRKEITNLLLLDFGYKKSERENETEIQKQKRYAFESWFINEKKTRIYALNQKFRFLQFQYHLTESGRLVIKMNRKRLYAMRRKLKKLNHKDIPYDDIKNTLKGWYGNFYKHMSKSQRKNLVYLYDKLFKEKEGGTIWTELMALHLKKKKK